MLHREVRCKRDPQVPLPDRWTMTLEREQAKRSDDTSPILVVAYLGSARAYVNQYAINLRPVYTRVEFCQ